MENGRDAVVGRNAVRELLRSGERIDKIYIAEGKRDSVLSEIIKEARKASVPVVTVPVSRLNALSGKVPHQSVAALVSAVEYTTVDDMLTLARERGEEPFLVIADGIEDPRNLGALIRSAECAGAHGLIIPKHKSVSLNSTVAKTSAGAVAHLGVARVTNLSNEIRALKEKGLWIYICEAGGDIVYEKDVTGPAAFVFGSEGKGVSEHVKKAGDFIVSLPLCGKINSLNVSCAAAAVLSFVAYKRSKSN